MGIGDEVFGADISFIRTQITREVFPKFDAFRIDSFEQHEELSACDLDARSGRAREARELERAALESLREQPESVAIPCQNLHPITPSVEEDEEVSRERVVVERVAHDGVKAIEGLPEVHGVPRQEDANGRRQAQHDDNTEIRRRRASTSKSGAT